MFTLKKRSVKIKSQHQTKKFEAVLNYSSFTQLINDTISACNLQLLTDN